MQCIIAVLATIFLLQTRPGFVQPVPASVPDVRMTCEAGRESVRPGETFMILCTLDIPRDFHVYWKSPGASGTPTEFQVGGGANLQVGETLYPRPAMFDDEAGRTYGYEGRTQFLVPVTVPADCPEGTVPITVKGRWLACRKACWRGEATRGIEVVVSSDTSSDERPEISRAARCMPIPLSSMDGASISLENSTLEIRGPIGRRGLPRLVPVEIPGVIHADPRISRDGEEFLVRIPYRLEPANSLGAEPRVEGLLLFGEERHDPSFAFTMLIPPAERGAGGEDTSNRRNAP